MFHPQKGNNCYTLFLVPSTADLRFYFTYMFVITLIHCLDSENKVYGKRKNSCMCLYIVFCIMNCFNEGVHTFFMIASSFLI